MSRWGRARFSLVQFQAAIAVSLLLRSPQPCHSVTTTRWLCLSLWRRCHHQSVQPGAVSSVGMPAYMAPPLPRSQPEAAPSEREAGLLTRFDNNLAKGKNASGGL